MYAAGTRELIQWIQRHVRGAVQWLVECSTAKHMKEMCQPWPQTAPELYSNIHALAHARASKLHPGDPGVDARQTNSKVTTWSLASTVRPNDSTGPGK
jgi:hypothetical protein